MDFKKDNSNFPSVSQRDWINPEVIYEEVSLKDLCQNLNVSEGLGKILASRDLLNPGEARKYLNPAEDQLHDPDTMLGIGTAVRRIHSALENYQKILVFGDYDVDGTASATILYAFIKRLGGRSHYFIPHRITDGYGLNPGNIAKFKDWGVDLLITTDHGSTDVAGALLLEKEGIDLIITDHHQLGPEKPVCLALVNPQQKECPYPFKQLSATGVAFKVISSLDRYLQELDYYDKKGIRRTAPSYYLDLVALATVADLTPLIGENRILVKLGLDAINNNPRPGLSGLIKECNIRGAVSPNNISFKLAPKINALGRIGEPKLGVQLFTSHSHTEARKLARFLVKVNHERKVIEQEVFSKVLKQLEEMEDHPGYVLVGDNWHPGIIGSIATRIAFKTKKPTVVLTLQESPQATGSARSWNGFNVLKALTRCESLLDRFGGHPSAAGLSLSPENIEAFTKKFHQAVVQGFDDVPDLIGNALKIDAWITPNMLNSHFLEEINLLSPFGYCNPEPVLAMEKMSFEDLEVFHNRHLRFRLRSQEGTEWDGVAWDHSDWDLNASQYYDIAFALQMIEGPSGPRTQLKVLDCIPCD